MIIEKASRKIAEIMRENDDVTIKNFDEKHSHGWHYMKGEKCLFTVRFDKKFDVDLTMFGENDALKQ